MRRRAIGFLALAGAAACASSSAGSDEPPTRRSTVSLGEPAAVLFIEAGPVRVSHAVPSGARLRGTSLIGIDPANRHLRYSWNRDGRYEVEVTGRYEHTVSGSAIGGAGLRLTSTIAYSPGGS